MGGGGDGNDEDGINGAVMGDDVQGVISYSATLQE